MEQLLTNNMHGALLRFATSDDPIAELRACAPLPDEAQRLIDDEVKRVALERLTIVADVMTEGLTFPLSNWLSVPELYWEKESKVGHAQRTMNPKTRGERQVAQRTGVRLPIYCTLDDFSFGIRELAAAERAGAPLNVSHVGQATRRVNEAIEDAMIYGWRDEGDTQLVNVAGNTAPGILNAPNANTYQYLGGATGRAWDDASKTGEHILIDVLDMIDELQSDNMFGPYNLYVGTSYGNKLNSDFKANSDKTIRQRLEEIEVGGRNLRIRVADRLSQHQTILMQMTSNVVQVVMGQEPTEVSWEDGPGWERFFAVLACIVPRVMDDYNNQSGIVIGNTT